MPLDVEKIKQQAAKIAGDAATAANEIAENAKPFVERASVTVDELAEMGRPYVERAEKEVKDAVDNIMGRNSGNGGGGAF